jgi:hypothetical protein
MPSSGSWSPPQAVVAVCNLCTVCECTARTYAFLTWRCLVSRRSHAVSVACPPHVVCRGVARQAGMAPPVRRIRWPVRAGDARSCRPWRRPVAEPLADPAAWSFDLRHLTFSTLAVWNSFWGSTANSLQAPCRVALASAHSRMCTLYRYLASQEHAICTPHCAPRPIADELAPWCGGGLHVSDS